MTHDNNMSKKHSGIMMLRLLASKKLNHLYIFSKQILKKKKKRYSESEILKTFQNERFKLALAGESQFSSQGWSLFILSAYS